MKVAPLFASDALTRNNAFLNQLFYQSMEQSIEVDYLLQLFPSAPQTIYVITSYIKEETILHTSLVELLQSANDCIRACGLTGHAFLSGHDYFIFLIENGAYNQQSLSTCLDILLKYTREVYGIENVQYASRICNLDASLGTELHSLLTELSVCRYYGRTIDTQKLKSISYYQLQTLIDDVETQCELGETRTSISIFKKAVQKFHQDCRPPMNVKRSILRIMYSFFPIRDQRGIDQPYYDIPHFMIEQVLKADTLYKTEQLVDSFCDYVLRRESEIPKTIPEPVKNALEYIHTNYQRPIKLKEVANAIHLNKSYLSQLFQKTMGVTYSEYLMELRITSAKDYLKTTNKSASEIAEILGFSSQNYFTKVFKNSVGVSPIRFRYTQSNCNANIP